MRRGTVIRCKFDSVRKLYDIYTRSSFSAITRLQRRRCTCSRIFRRGKKKKKKRERIWCKGNSFHARLKIGAKVTRPGGARGASVFGKPVTKQCSRDESSLLTDATIQSTVSLPLSPTTPPAASHHPHPSGQPA